MTDDARAMRLVASLLRLLLSVSYSQCSCVSHSLISPLQLAPSIADAIRDADLNLNPSVDGNNVKVPVPKSSKETREATVKLISKIAEQAKTRIRRVRQSALDDAKKATGVSEDDVRRETASIDEHIAAATKEVAAAADKKKLEVEAS
jgi:ribosome recycling factor